jgi:hypothetical protein
MTMLREAARHFAGRPPEEHFPDLPALVADARAQKERSRTAHVSDGGILYVADGAQIVADLGGPAGEVELSHYARTQLGNLTGVPIRVQDKLTARTCATVLNETMPRDHNGTDARSGLLEDGAGDGGRPRARAITTQVYHRLWDADLYAEAGRWLPEGWEPAYPELHVLWNREDTGDRSNINGNDKPALFRSDRDSFAFFHGSREEDGGTFGGLRPGLMLWNSEVGASSFGWRRFYFRAMCCNFLIWDATQIKTRRSRHTRQVGRIYGMLRRELQRIAAPMTTAELDAFAKATRAPFVSWSETEKETREKAADKLYRMRGVSITQTQAAAAIKAAADEERNASPDAGGAWLSSWDVANGLTWAAQRVRYTKDRANLQEAAGAVLAAAQ